MPNPKQNHLPLKTPQNCILPNSSRNYPPIRTNVKTMQTFSSVKEAMHYLLNEKWKELPPEIRKELRDVKRDFNFKGVSQKRMTQVLEKCGTLEVKVKFELDKFD